MIAELIEYIPDHSAVVLGNGFYKKRKMFRLVSLASCTTSKRTEKRWQPVDVGLGVRVEEDENLSLGGAGSFLASANQPRPLAQMNHANLLSQSDCFVNVFVQLLLAMLCGGTR